MPLAMFLAVAVLVQAGRSKVCTAHSAQRADAVRGAAEHAHRRQHRRQHRHQGLLRPAAGRRQTPQSRYWSPVLVACMRKPLATLNAMVKTNKPWDKSLRGA